MVDIKQSLEDYQKRLEEQIWLLHIMIKNYDSWEKIVAINIATILRTLLHDSKNSVSLFSLLGLKKRKFFDLSHDPIGWELTYSLLTYCFLWETSAMSLPNLDSCWEWKLLNFDLWWNNVVIQDIYCNMFSRKDLILNLTNKDWGTHIAQEIPGKYYALTRNNSIWFIIGWYPAVDIHCISIRHIAHEVLKTLDEEYICKGEVLENGYCIYWVSLK